MSGKKLVLSLLLIGIHGCGDPPRSITASSGVGEPAIHLPAMTAPAEAPFDVAIDDWATIQVDPTVPESSTDGSGTAVVPDLQTAMKLAVAQDPLAPTRIRLAAGVFPGLGEVVGVRRTATSPIVISGSLGEAGERLTVVDGGADGLEDRGANCIRFSNVSYLAIENLHCRNAFPHGINVDDGSDYRTPTDHFIVRNVYIGNVGLFARTGTGTNSDCLKLSGVDDFQVVGSEFEHCVWGEFIDMVGSHRGLIADNYFHDKPMNGIQTKGGSSDILITRNVLARIRGRFVQLGGDTGQPYYRPIDAAYPASRIRVIANILRDDRKGREMTALFSINGCRDCLVANNTALNVQRGTLIAYLDREDAKRDGNRNVILANNLYVMDDAEGRPYTRPGEAVAFRISRNGELSARTVSFLREVFFDRNNPDWNAVLVPKRLAESQFSSLGFFDPEVDESGRISSSSPASGFGSPAFAPLIPGDFDGAAFGSPPAVGAFAGSERVSSTAR